MTSLELAAVLVLGLGSAAAGQELVPQARPGHVMFTPPHRAFTCEIPASWQPFEEETSQGSSVHFLGPAEADGAYRAAIHVHYVQKGRPGFVPIEAAVKRERRSDKATSRDASAITYWRAAKTQARRFEVTETRQLPREVMPSHPVVLHHYYVFIPAGDGYFMVKMSSTRETYLKYRPDFERLLSSFLIAGG